MSKNNTVFRPNNLKELDRIIEQIAPPITFVAGATDLMVQTEKWRAADNLIDLTSVSELRETLEVTDSSVRIGAAVPYSRIIKNSVVRERLPILVEACRQIGSVQIQNRGTLGGNIANASPAGDSLPVLAVLDADILIGPARNGKFTIKKIDEIMTGPGQTILGEKQYIAFIEIPFPEKEGQFWAFRKVGQRSALAISKLNLAVLGWLNDGIVKDIRICSGSVAPQINRHRRTEEILRDKKPDEKLIEQACRMIRSEISPISDIRSTEEYRRHTTAEVLRDILYQTFAIYDL